MNSSYPVYNLRNFNELFGKDVTYNHIKVTRNHGFTLSLKDTYFEKLKEGGGAN